MTSLAPRRPASWFALAGFLAAVAVVAGVGALAASDSRETYRALDLPPFAPPGWLFGPVWTVLYVLMAISAWLVWQRTGWGRESTLWVAQLVLNLAWTPLFFALDAYVLALVDIVLLLAALVTLTLWVRRVRGVAAWLLVPYIAWVAFATALNAAIVVLN